MINLHHQVALVTGGSRGIGASVAIRLAKSGAAVAIMYRKDRRSALEIVRKISRMGGTAICVGGEVSRFSDCRKVVNQTISAFGRIDILVNNAGIWDRGDILTMKPREWRRSIEINLFGTFNMMRLVAPLMKKRKYGRIINISSTAGIRGEAYHSPYAASKGAVIALTKSVALELIPYGINVNCVAPGWVVTDMTANVLKPKKSREAIRKSIPRNVLPMPDEISGSVLFLASNLSNHLVGATINVNGGSVLSS